MLYTHTRARLTTLRNLVYSSAQLSHVRVGGCELVLSGSQLGLVSAVA